jgi:lipopolysaccharide/colanic/teichoic acid biosynthesis glycosyltransferase
MKKNSDKKSLLTVGEKDSRITNIGYFLRKYKIDELPQLFNVLIGDMSLVGPRPEVRKYVEMYNPEQKKILSVKPGITDYASIAYANENEILSKSENPEQLYITEVMPAKLKLNLKYIVEKSFFTDLKIIFMTIGKIVS